MQISDVKPTDRVIRYIGSGDAQSVWMEMEVTEVSDNLITCKAVTKDDAGKEIGFFIGGWTFDRKTGVEEDADLKWGVKFGRTGSIIKPKEPNSPHPSQDQP